MRPRVDRPGGPVASPGGVPATAGGRRPVGRQLRPGAGAAARLARGRDHRAGDHVGTCYPRRRAVGDDRRRVLDRDPATGVPSCPARCGRVSPGVRPRRCARRREDACVTAAIGAVLVGIVAFLVTRDLLRRGAWPADGARSLSLYVLLGIFFGFSTCSSPTHRRRILRAWRRRHDRRASLLQLRRDHDHRVWRPRTGDRPRPCPHRASRSSSASSTSSRSSRCS